MKKKIKNIGKRFLSFTLSVVLAAGLLPAAGTARAEQAENFSLDNGYIRTEVSKDNGGFAIRTVEGSKVNKDDNNKSLLFHSDEDDTSFTSFQVIRNGEKKEYIFGGSYPGSSEVKTVQSNEEIRSEWSVDNITFTQIISLVNSGSNEHGTVHIGYTAKNTGEAAEIKCRILLDTALGNQDYAYYNIGDNNHLTESETTISEGGYQKSFYAVDNPQNPAVVAYTINAAVDNRECVPYQTTFAHWNNLAATMFDYTPNSSMTFTNPNNKDYLTADSAYALYFDMGELEKDASINIATNYGIFSNETVDRENTAAVNVIGPDVMELTEDKTSYKNEGKFTVNTEIENISEITYERVRVVVYTTGKITPVDEEGVLQGDAYYRDFTNFVPGQRQTIEWDFQALPGDEGIYSKIQYKIYDISDDATLNTGKLLDENLMGEGKRYLLCPGSINEIPAIQFTGSSPDVLYTTGARNLYITGLNFSMLENKGEYTLMLSRVDGQRFLGTDSVAIPAEQIKIDGAKNSMTLVMNDNCPGELPEGQYQLTFDYTDSAKQDITAPALRFQVKQEEKYRNDSYGVLAVEKTADENYYIRTFASDEEYQKGIDSGEIDRDAMLLEFRGSFSKNTKAAAGSTVYQGISLNESDNVMTLNNCLDIRKGMVTVTESGGSVKVDFDASIYTTGAGTSVWSGVAALTELKSGEDYGLIPYEENGDRSDFSSETITLLWPGIGQAAQNLMGFLMDFKYGELGVISHGDAPETRVVAFGAAMDLSFVIPKISQQENSQSLLGDAYSEATHNGTVDAEALRTINQRIPYNTETVNTSATSMDSAGSEEDGEDDDDKTISASVQIDDVLFGGEYLGVNLSIGLGIPGYVEGMPSLEGVLTVKTIGDWELGVEGTCDFSVCCFEGEIYIKSKNGIPVPDTIKFFLGGVTPGINIDGMGILWLQGGGGGIENLYDTIFLQDCIPPLKVILEMQFSLMQVISARASLELSLRGFGIELSDGKVANAVPVLDRARLQFDWYPSFYFLGSVNLSIYDAIVGGGYIVAEDNGFFEFFVRAALQVPDNVPIVGGMRITQAGLGANNQKIWGQVEFLLTRVGIVYYWGGNIDWGGGAEAAPTYPDLLGAVDAGLDTALMSGDVPVYYDEETGRTLYAHVGTNLNSDVQTVSHITSVKSLDQNALHTSIDAKTHTISLAENEKDKILVLEWNAESREEAEEDVKKLRISNNVNDVVLEKYPLVLLDHEKSAESQETANANLNWLEETKKASLAVSFTKPEDFKKLWTITMPKESTALLYDIEPLPALSEDTEINISAAGEVTVDLSGTNLEKFNSLNFMAIEKDSKGLSSIVQNALRQNGRAVNTESGEAQLVYRTEDLTNKKISFTLPDTFESGDYKLRLIAEDEGGNYYSEIEKDFSYENKNQPAKPIIEEIKNAGDYKASVTFNDNDEEFDGYLFTAYDKEGNPVTGLNQLLYYKDGTSVKYEEDGSIAEYLGKEPAKEFTIGGHYEYQPEQAEGEEPKQAVTAGFLAGEYTIEVKKWKRVSNGKKVLTSESSTGNISITEPKQTVIEVSADKEGKKITEIINKEACERFVYKASELTLTLSADQKITGKWTLDNKESGEIKDLTQKASLPFDSLQDGVHTLEFVGKNENGDAAAATYVFGIDTTGPRLLLSSPISGSFFSNSDGTLEIAGITDKDAILSVYDLTKDSEVVSKQELTVNEEDGSFTAEVKLDKTIAKHKLRIFVEDSVGNISEKEVQVISDALGSIESLELFSQEKKITNQKISAGSTCELSARAVLSDGSIIELNDPTLIEWKQISAEGEAVLSEVDGRAMLSIPEGAEGIVTARFIVNDAGAYSVSAAFGESNNHSISLDSADTIIKVDDGWYTGKEVTPKVQVWYKGAKLTEGEDYTVEFENNIEASETAADTVLPALAGQSAGLSFQTQISPKQEAPRAVVTGINNYKDSSSKEFKIYYLPAEDSQGNILYEISGVGNKYYTSDVLIVPQKGYEISTKQLEGYQTEGISIKEEGLRSETFYIRRISDGALTNKITADITIDKTAPTGEIRLDAKSWDSFLENITFGRYKVNNYQITISGEDKISGLAGISYAVSEKSYSSVSELTEADLSWKEYKEDDKPEIEKNKNQVIYARLADNAGNQKYISSEGILIDDTAPEITNAEIKNDTSLKDTQADITFVLSEAGTYYYAVLPENSEAPDFEALKAQKISGAVMGSGVINPDKAGQTVTLTVKGLSAGTSYKLYIAAEDKTVELGTDKPAGNKSKVTASSAVTTKLQVPVITEIPEIKGTYGMKVCDMELTGGVVCAGGHSIQGTFSVDSEEIPSTDSETEYEVIFTPENDSYASVSVPVKPEVAPRALTAEEVLVSEIHGSFIYNKAEHTPQVTVSDSYAAITPEDYDILYQNNINAGTAEIIIRGKHNYKGERKINFEIEKCEAEISIEAGKEGYQKTEGDEAFKLDGIVTDSDGKISYLSENEEVVQVSEDGLAHIVGKGKALVKVSILESGNYKASETVEIIINVKEKEIKISLDSADTIMEVDDGWYTGKEVAPKVQVWYKQTKLTEGEDYTVEFENNIEANETAADTVLPVLAGQSAGLSLLTQISPKQEAPRAVVTGINGYKDSISREFKIYYLPAQNSQENTIYQISGIGGEYYTSDVLIIPQEGYEISTNPQEGYQTEGISIKEEGRHSVAFYIRRASDGALTDKINADITIDKTAPKGEIRLDAKSWDSFLENITFGQYKVKNYQITIDGEDTISGMADIFYTISEEAYSSVSELAAADLDWTEYKEDNKPEIEKNKKQVIYARLADNAGNQRYISSEGILTDDTAPDITNAGIKTDVSLKDTQADITFTLSEAGTYYYAVLPENLEAPDFEALKAQKINGAVTGSGDVGADKAGQPVTLTVTGLSAGISYKLYIAAEDKTVELGTDKPAGNKSKVTASSAVTTKLQVPVVTEMPKIKGVYGTKVCDMELIPGVAKVGENSVEGTFTASSQEIPSVDSTKKYEVVFTPDDNSYAAVLVLAEPEVAPRALTAEEVLVSEIHGSFVYNKAEHRPQVTVSDSYAAITPGDYEILYQNNINAGTAEIIIKGSHNYTGERRISFEIEKCEPKISIEAGKESYQKTEGDKDFELNGIVTDSDGKISYQSMNEEVVQVSENGKVHVIGKGNALIKVSILESGNYKASKTVEIVIDVKERKEETSSEEEVSSDDETSSSEEISSDDETSSSEEEVSSDDETSTSKETTSTAKITNTQKQHTDSADGGIQNTGDSMQPGKYMIMLVLAGMFMAAAVCGRRKRK